MLIPNLSTNRLDMRGPNSQEDFRTVHKAIRSNFGRLSIFLDAKSIGDIGDEKAIKKWLKDMERSGTTSSAWLMFQRSDSSQQVATPKPGFIGMVIVHTLRQNHYGLTWWLVKEAERCGYMHEAVSAAQNALWQRGAQTIQARCNTSNPRSKKLIEGLGYATAANLLRQDTLVTYVLNRKTTMRLSA